MDGSFPDFEENRTSGEDTNDPVECDRQQVTILSEDAAIIGNLREFLRQHGLAMQAMAAGDPRILDVGHGEGELVIIDAAIAGMIDWALLRHFSLRGDRPAIIVIGDGTDAIDRIIGLELGADDYVGKDLHNRELLARIRAVLRRRLPLSGHDQPYDPLPREWRAVSPPAPRETGTTTEHALFGAWRVSLRDRQLLYADAGAVRLTRTEFTMLGIFLRHPGQIIPRRTLLDLIYGDSPENERTIDVLVSRLRRKLGRCDDEIIRTIRGRGYLFMPEIRWV